MNERNQTEEAVAQEKQPMLSLKNKIIRFFSKLFRK